MDLESIIYILIVVALAIANAVSQKRKRSAKAAPQPIAVTPESREYEMDEEDAPFAEQPQPPTPFEELIYELERPTAQELGVAHPDVPLDNLDGLEAQPPQPVQQAPLLFQGESPAAAAPLNPDAEGQRTVPSPYLAKVFEISSDIYDGEDSIRATAIGDAEEPTAQTLAGGELEGFSARRALVFAEIITPKYFQV